MAEATAVNTGLSPHGRHRLFLMFRLSRRYLSAAYGNTKTGMLLFLLKPLLFLSIYIVVFGVVLGIRWDAGSGMGFTSSCALPLFIGLVVFEFFACIITEAPSLLRDNAAFIKKVVFPVEVIPAAFVLRAVIVLILSLFVGTAATAVVTGNISLLCLPVLVCAIALLMCAGLGVSLLVSVAGAFLPDTKHVAEVFVRILIFTAPIFYPLDKVPEGLQVWVERNPLTLAVVVARDLCVWQRLPDPAHLEGFALACVAALVGGVVVFRRCRPGFAEVV